MSENTSIGTAPVASPPDAGAPAPKRNRFERKNDKKGMPKLIKVGVPLLLVGGILFGAAKFILGNTRGSAGSIVEATADYGSISSYVTGWGSISPVSKAEYGADIKGEVTTVDVKAGDIVKVGDLLFTIDPSEMKADLLKQKSDLAALEKQLHDLDKNYNKALKTLKSAQDAYNNSAVRAPFSGMVLNVSESLPKVGDSLSTGAVLGKLVDSSAMRLKLYFNRSYMSSVKVGQTAAVSVPGNMTQVSGTVTSISDQRKPINGTECFCVEIKVNNPGGLTEGQDAMAAVSTDSGEIRPSESGKLEYWQTEDIIFNGVTADVTSISLHQYDSVTQGQLLCSVDPSPAADAISDAQYDVETYTRQMSDDYIQNDIKKAQKKIDELEQICSTSAFYATIDGQVSAVMIKPGDKLTASETAVLTISDTSSLVINANIDESNIANVKTGMSVDITYDTTDGPGTASGTITYVSFEAKSGSSDMGSAYAYFPATITLDNDGSLLPGMSANYSILAVSRDSCLVLPSQCIINTEAGPVVYVKDGQDFTYDRAAIEGIGDAIPDGYYPVSVEIGIADDTNTEIVSGIEAGTVVYQGTMTKDSGYWG